MTVGSHARIELQSYSPEYQRRVAEHKRVTRLEITYLRSGSLSVKPRHENHMRQVGCERGKGNIPPSLTKPAPSPSSFLPATRQGMLLSRYTKRKNRIDSEYTRNESATLMSPSQRNIGIEIARPAAVPLAAAFASRRNPPVPCSIACSPPSGN